MNRWIIAGVLPATGLDHPTDRDALESVARSHAAKVQGHILMNTIDRRRFFETGAMAVGLAGLGAEEALTQTLGNVGTDENRPPVRMIGDGLSLSPAESAELWSELAHDQPIVQDAYSNGGTVQELEQQFAETLGKERAVFMPTGTLANHLAVRSLAGATGRALVQAESHLFNDSGDCVQTLSGINLIPLAPDRASFTLADVEEAVARARSGRVTTPVSVISIESPVRRRFGETFDDAELARIVDFARREEIRLHLDGARIFLQSAYTGRSVADYAAPFDTVYVSLYKYFNAASGAILAGPRALLDEMFHTRRMFGAGLPGAWPFASIALNYAPGFVARYRQAIETSETWIEQIERHTAFTVERIPSGTNIFTLRVSHPDLRAFRSRLAERGVQIGPPRGGDRFLLTVNETWNRATADTLADAFVEAVGA